MPKGSGNPGVDHLDWTPASLPGCERDSWGDNNGSGKARGGPRARPPALKRRHSRESGNPGVGAPWLDPRLRGGDNKDSTWSVGIGQVGWTTSWTCFPASYKSMTWPNPSASALRKIAPAA